MVRAIDRAMWEALSAFARGWYARVSDPVLRAMLGEQLGVEARSVHAYIVGEHGDSEIAAWSSAQIAGLGVRAYCDSGDESPPDLDALLTRVRTAAPQIIKHKGYTSYAIASCVTRICEAILRDERTVLPVSTLLRGQYGIEGVYLSLPCVVGRGGVDELAFGGAFEQLRRLGVRRDQHVAPQPLERQVAAPELRAVIATRAERGRRSCRA